MNMILGIISLCIGLGLAGISNVLRDINKSLKEIRDEINDLKFRIH